MVTEWQLHVNKWRDCKECGLSETRTKTVLGRGKVPCDVLFVGEAPGRSEDVVGKPFVGPAGKLLNLIIQRASIDNPDGTPRWTYAMTNVVCCLPLGDDGEKTAEPPDECVQACGPRLAEMAWLADPLLVVCVGKLPLEYLDTGYRHSIKLHKVCEVCHRRLPRLGYEGKVPTYGTCAAGHSGAKAVDLPRVGITHPAAILRANVIHQGIGVQRAAAVLATAIDTYVEKYLLASQ